MPLEKISFKITEIKLFTEKGKFFALWNIYFFVLKNTFSKAV